MLQAWSGYAFISIPILHIHKTQTQTQPQPPNTKTQPQPKKHIIYYNLKGKKNKKKTDKQTNK